MRTVCKGWEVAELRDGLGGERGDYGDNGSGKKTGWVGLPGED